MSKNSRIFAFLFFILLINATTAVSLEYEKFSHRIFLDSLRAGNQDSDGTNEYYFTVTISAIRSTAEDLLLEQDKRETKKESPANFGDLTIPVLTQWKSATGKPEEEVFYDITGDTIRSLVADMMRLQKVKESEVAVLVEVSLMEKNKEYWFFGKDTEVGTAKYFPVPVTKAQTPARSNLKLRIVDDQGTEVLLKVKYKEPATVATESPPAAASPAPKAESGK